MSDQSAEVKSLLPLRDEKGACRLHHGLLCDLHDAWCRFLHSEGPCDCFLAQREREHEEYESNRTPIPPTEREQALEKALLRVLAWPLPGGLTVESYSLPAWLASRARMALDLGVWDDE